MNQERYEKISNWFLEKEIRYKLLKLCYSLLPVLVGVIYAGIMAAAFLFMEMDVVGKVKVVLVPGVTFAICTIFRHLIDEKRPYEKMDIVPLIKKDKRGQSFPSRHVLSAAVISVSGFYVNFYVGMVLSLLTILIAVIRPVAGVHYIRDVLAGMALGVICGYVGFFVI